MNDLNLQNIEAEKERKRKEDRDAKKKRRTRPRPRPRRDARTTVEWRANDRQRPSVDPTTHTKSEEATITDSEAVADAVTLVEAYA